MPFVLTVTFNPCIDINVSVAELSPEIKLRCSVPSIYPGGGGINVARAIHRLGGDALALFAAGGNAGARLASLLEQEGVSFMAVPLFADTRENVIVTERASGQQYRLNFPGPPMGVDTLQEMLDIIARKKRVEFLVVSGSLAPGMSGDIYRELKSIADKKEMKLIVDTSGPALKDAVRHGAYLIKPSKHELLSLYGEKDEAQLPRLARDLVTGGDCRIVVVSMGAGGAMLVTGDREERISAPVVQAVSTVGAGDSMVGGIVWSLHNGHSPSEAVRFGCVCGAAATLHPGTSLFLPEDTQTLQARTTGNGYGVITNEIHAIK